MSTIRVAFDDQIFVAQRRGGVSKLFVEQFKRFPDHGVEPVILARHTRNLHLAESGLVPIVPPRNAAVEKVTWFSWRAIGRPRAQSRRFPDVDLLHHTFSHPSYLHLGDVPRVTSIHDMTPELMPEYFRLGNPHFAKRRYCEKSDALISVSQNTANDMLRLYGDHLRPKISVIPHGVGPEFLRPVTEHHLQLPDEYVLFVGVRSGYKDFDIAFAAFRELAAKHSDLHLVIIGGGPVSPAELSQFTAAGLSARVHHLRPSDENMPEVYARARAFVFPSRYEGFGLPTLEALSTGTPAIVADASCSREVGGDAAIYFEPRNVTELVERIEEALTPAGQERGRDLGPARGALFSWDHAVAMTADLYRSLL